MIAVEQERVIAAALGDASHLREFGLGGDGWLPGHWEEDRERSELTSTEAAGNRQNWAGFAAGGPTGRENLQWAIARRYSGRAQWTWENAKRLAALAVTVVTAGPEKSSLEILKLLEYYQYQYQEASEAAARSYENKLKEETLTPETAAARKAADKVVGKKTHSGFGGQSIASSAPKPKPKAKNGRGQGY